MKPRTPVAALAFVAFLAAGPALAQAQSSSMAMPMGSASSPPAAGQVAVTEGEVRKVDTAAQKLTLKHGDIRNLGMPGMTMVFKVADPQMLSAVHEGDKVRFTADRIGGVLTVTSIEPSAK
jgi:Cu/Ag efflux protein CusF